jgi:hypothetical protein
MPTVNQAIKMWSNQSSNATTSENFRKFEVTFSETYQITTSFDATELDVYTQAGLPGIAQSYPGFPFVVAEAAQLQRVSPIFWLATVNYRGEIGGIAQTSGGSEPSNPTSPLYAPPRITWDDVETSEDIDVDFDGDPITNTAGQPVKGVKALFSDQLLTVTRNFLVFNTYTQAVYRRSVNSDLFLGWPPGTCKLMKLSAQNVIDQAFGYWTVTGVFQFRFPYNTTPDKAWYARYVSMGLKQRDSSGKLVAVTDDNNDVTTTPQYLDEDGKQIKPPAGTTPAPHWIETKLYGSLPYNALGLI